MMNYTLRQDDDGHWYKIPNDLLDKFDDNLSKIIGKDYLDAADDFDSFTNEFDKYRTFGDPNN